MKLNLFAPTKIVDKLEKSLIDNSLTCESTIPDVSNPKANIEKKKFYSVVMKIATKNQLSLNDLEQILEPVAVGESQKRCIILY